MTKQTVESEFARAGLPCRYNPATDWGQVYVDTGKWRGYVRLPKTAGLTEAEAGKVLRSHLSTYNIPRKEQQ